MGKFFNKVKQSNVISPVKCRISDYLNKKNILKRRLIVVPDHSKPNNNNKKEDYKTHKRAG